MHISREIFSPDCPISRLWDSFTCYNVITYPCGRRNYECSGQTTTITSIFSAHIDQYITLFVKNHHFLLRRNNKIDTILEKKISQWRPMSLKMLNFNFLRRNDIILLIWPPLVIQWWTETRSYTIWRLYVTE